MSHPIWKKYLAATCDRGARPLLERALTLLQGGHYALDLGCGAGGDTLALLQCGYDVLAVDALKDALTHTYARAVSRGIEHKLQTRHSRFEELILEPGLFDLVFAGFSLPFCAVASFDDLFATLGDSLVPGGILAGQFFGDRDAWACDPDNPAQLFFSRTELERRFERFHVLHLEEVEERRATALGDEKDWHLFHVVARKPGHPTDGIP